jgi:hypothetical protein
MTISRHIAENHDIVCMDRASKNTNSYHSSQVYKLRVGGIYKSTAHHLSLRHLLRRTSLSNSLHFTSNFSSIIVFNLVRLG